MGARPCFLWWQLRRRWRIRRGCCWIFSVRRHVAAGGPTFGHVGHGAERTAPLQSSENFEHAGHSFVDHGIGVSGLTIDVAKMLARKNKVVAQNNDGILYLFKKNKITFFHGFGSFAGKEGDLWRLTVAGAKP